MSAPRLLTLIVLLAAANGCALMRDTTKSVGNIFKLESDDGTLAADNPGDPWIEAAATEGRHGRKREVEYDPLNVKKYMMSEQARAIERNVGIE